MILQIHDNLLIADLQEKFSQCFPSLSIEFYNKPHRAGIPTSDKYLIDASKKVGDIRRNRKEGPLEIKSWFTVAQVEKAFHEKYGLNVQIFRKEKTGSVQTSKTDKYTLMEQRDMVHNS